VYSVVNLSHGGQPSAPPCGRARRWPSGWGLTPCGWGTLRGVPAVLRAPSGRAADWAVSRRRLQYTPSCGFFQPFCATPRGVPRLTLEG